MKQEYLEKFIKANEELTISSIDNLKGFEGSEEDLNAYIRLYSEASKQHLAALKQLQEADDARENVALEYEKLHVSHEDFVIQQKQAAQVEILNASKDLVMQLAGMIFYTARFREGLRFDIDNYVNDGFVRSLVQKLPDFMKSKK